MNSWYHTVFDYHRTLSFIKKYYNGEIPNFEANDEDDKMNEMIAQVTIELKAYIEAMECIKYTITHVINLFNL